jgi:CHAT domain-containing protein
VAAALGRRLPSDHLYLEYLLGEEDLVVFALQRGRLAVHRQRGAAAEVRRLAASVRFHLDADPWADATSRGARRLSLEARLRRLGELLLAPVEASPGWRVLWVAPDRGLYHLPWSALELAGGQLLLDRGAVTLVPGASVAGALLGSEHRRPESVALAGFAGAGLDLVEPEIRELARLLPHAVERTAARRDEVLELLAGHDLVHLAGHALFVDGAAGASGLKLEDGYLTVHDLAATPMRARLVSFGVCSGVRVADGERYRFDGFVRALLGAGVRSVVGPVAWVRDPLAHAFALAFHDRLRHEVGPAEAFRHAVLTLRDSDPHPAAWGTFQHFGDGRPWRSE